MAMNGIVIPPTACDLLRGVRQEPGVGNDNLPLHRVDGERVQVLATLGEHEGAVPLMSRDLRPDPVLGHREVDDDRVRDPGSVAGHAPSSVRAARG